MLSDLPAERAVLSGIFRYGAEAYYDVADLVSEAAFTDDSNTVIFSCVKHILENDDSSEIDVPSMLSAAKELGLDSFFNTQEVQHLSSIMKFPVLLINVRKFAAKIKKLEIARMMYDQLELTKEKYLQVKGDESISKILGIAEDSIVEIATLVSGTDESPAPMFEDISEYLEELAKDPIDQIGIATGLPRYDFAIGGGLRRGTVNVIGARPKIGKTLLADNMGVHMAKKGIPVLNLDTEMRKEDHQNRLMAMLTEVPISDIETGSFGKNPATKAKVKKAAEEVKELPYYYKSIGGCSFEEQLSIIRRWINRVVGLNDKGNANDCVVIYDYLKLMDSSEIQGDMREFQVLGFMMTALHNLSLKYEIPILSFVQLNRDGINKESTDTASGSDRIIWLCSNFTIYKSKSDEEIAKDGIENGNRKLVPVIARHGKGLEDRDYINITMKGSCGKVVEGKTAFELDSSVSATEEDDHYDDTEDDIPFK